MPDKKLATYRKKRNLKKSSEPAGGPKRRRGQSPMFVIQKHAATRLHYDFRLEVDGVLKSWAVTKGPSTDPKERRLAIQVEDHPLDYGSFEGTIPEGEYGAGTVMVWDTGTYRNLTEKEGKEVPVAEAIEEGHVKVRLEGQKLKGGYALNRMGDGAKPRWLLVKMKDEEARPGRDLLKSRTKSALSDRTLDRIAKEENSG